MSDRLVAAIKYLLDDEEARESISSRILRKAEADNWGETAKKHIQVYQEITKC
jgi:glycosyltransferase involved in cell wall biosynthesis